MRKKFYYILLLTLILMGNTLVEAQSDNVGIGTTTPDGSSILELYSTEKGFLVPRMTTAQRNAIASPATGLLIYNTDNSRFEFNIGNPANPNWQPIVSGSLSGYVFGTAADGQVAYWNSSNTITGSNNFYWDYNQNRLGLGNNTPRERLDLVDGSSIGAIILGSAEDAYAGSIQWNGSDFLGYDGSSWVSLTSSSTITGNGTIGQVTFWSNSGVLSGSNNLYWDNANSIMGIGTSTPSSTVTLDVNGNVRIQGDLEVTGQIDPISITLQPQGSAPSAVKGKVYYSSSDNQLKVYNGTSWNNLGSWTESGGNVYRESGDVAIGRTSPRERLDIQDASGNGAILLGNTTNSNPGTIKWDGFDFFGYDGSQWVSLTSGGGGGGGSSTITGSGSAGQVTIWSSTATITGNNNLYWNNVASRLGIGDNTPDHSLDVNGNIGLASGGFINFGDVDGTTGYGFRDAGGIIQFKNSGGSWQNFSALSGGDVYGSGTSGYIAFWNSSNTITGVSNLFWDNAQSRLGIGDNTPDHTVDIAGNLGLDANSYINFSDVDGVSGYGFRDNNGIIEFKNSGGSWQTFTALSGGNVYGNGTSGYLAYWNSSSTITGEANLFWDATQTRLGIGDNTPDHTVDIAGNLGLDADSFINFGDTDGETGYGLRDNGGVIQFKNSGGTWQALSTGGGGGGGDVYGSGTNGYVAFWNSSNTITGVSNLFWDNTQSRLGIGDNTPDHTVDIAGNLGLDASSYINFGDTDGSTGYGFRDNAGTLQFKNNGGSWTDFSTGGGNVYGTGTNGYIAYWNSSSTITGETNLFWDAAQTRLGIGDNTPDHTVDIAGNLGLDASSYINFGDTDGSTGYGFRDNAGTLQFKNSGGSWTDFSTGGGNVYGTGTNGYIAYWNSSSTITGETNLFWDAAQTRLGIGDNTPDHTVDIAGNLGLDASSYINFGDTDGSTGYGFRDNAGTIEYKNSGGSWNSIPSGNTLDDAYNQGGPGAGKYINVNNGTVGLYGSNSGTFTLELTNTANGGVLRLDNGGTGNSLIINESSGSYPFVINSTGAVGIGTSSPNAMLEITPTGNDAIIINPNSSSVPTNLKLLDAAGGEYVGFAAPNAVTSSVIWKLPTADGTNGQVLTTDGSGNLSWSSASGGSPGGNDGAVQYNNGGSFGGDETQFYWDDTNNRLGIGTNTPDAILQVSGPTGTNGLHVRAGENDGVDYIANFEDQDGTVQGMYIDASGDIGMGNTTPQDKLEVTGAVLRDGFFMAVRSSNQTGFDNTAQDINWNSQVRYDTDYYTHSTTTNSEQIQIDVTGWYRISYHINIDNNDNSRQSISVWIEDDGSEIAGSRIRIYARANGQGQFTGGGNSFLANITSGSVIVVRTQSTEAGADYEVEQNSQINIERIDQ